MNHNYDNERWKDNLFVISIKQNMSILFLGKKTIFSENDYIIH